MLSKVEFLEKIAAAAKMVEDSGERLSNREAIIASGLPVTDPNYCPIEKVVYLAVKFPSDVLRQLSQTEIAWGEYQRVEQALAS